MTDPYEPATELELIEEITVLLITKWTQRSMIENQAETIRQLRKRLEQDEND